MRTSLSAVLPLAALLVSVAQGAYAAEAGKQLTLLFSGDNGGEIAPCG